MPSPLPFLNERLAEAARYALMRRLLPAIRHSIAGTLQPIAMMSAMLARRMKAATPDLVQLANNADGLNTLSREAAATALDLMTWLAPKDNEPVAVNRAVEESLGLIATELSFRGFAIDNRTAEVTSLVPKAVLRHVFTASLIALTDSADAAASVLISAEGETGNIRLSISLEPGGSPELAAMGSPTTTYRTLNWADVQAIADAEGVQLHRSSRAAQLHYVEGQGTGA